MSGLFSLESWSTVWTHRESFLLGLGNTLQTAVCALALAFIIGAALGLMSTSGSKLLRIIARIYVEFVQNTPLLACCAAEALYPHWLAAQMDLALGETARAANELQLYTSYVQEFAVWVRRNYMPAGGGRLMT